MRQNKMRYTVNENRDNTFFSTVNVLVDYVFLAKKIIPNILK